MLNINFINPSATVAMNDELMTAIDHEGSEMVIQMLTDDISRLNTKISNLENNEDKDEETKEV